MTREEAIDKWIIPAIKNTWNEKKCAEIIEALEQEPCEDAISREDLLSKAWFVTGDDFPIEGLEYITKGMVKDMPPVIPQQKTGHWIPVSERLPEDGRPVLIYAWNVHHVIARYDSFRTENGYKKCWVTADAWNGNTEIEHEVIAWMPLPEPYKEESEDEG